MGTAYTPIKLQPKRLVNPFAAREAEAQAEAAQPKSTPVGASLCPTIREVDSSTHLGSGKKLTWSERQALAKKQAEEEEARSKAASFHPPPAAATPRTFGGVPPPPRAPVAPEPEEEEEYAPVRFSSHNSLVFVLTPIQASATTCTTSVYASSSACG